MRSLRYTAKSDLSRQSTGTMSASDSRAGWTGLVPAASFLMLVAVGLGLRWRHVLNYHCLLTGDDGIVALMALHILSGKEIPLVFYGQHYMGTLDAMVAALFFHWFGVSAEIYKLTVLLSAGLTLVLLGWAVWLLWGWRRACGAVALFALSPAAARWQMDQPNYGMLFLFGAGLLVVSVSLVSDARRRGGAWPVGLLCGWAFLAGVGFWAHSLIISLVLPLPFLMWLRGDVPPAKITGLAFTCFLVGLAPLVLHNIEYPFATLRQFAGFSLDVASRSDVQDLSVWQVVLRGIWHKIDPATVPRNLLVAVGGFGLSDYGALSLLSYPAVLTLVGLVAATGRVWWQGRRGQDWRGWIGSRTGLVLSWLLLTTGLVLILGSTRSRYMALLVLILPLLIVGRWNHAFWTGALHATLVAGLLLYLAAASLVLNVSKPLTLQNPVPGLARFLESQGLSLGYAGFGLAYPLAVHTRESVRVSPLAGPRVDDLYPPHTHAVESSPAPFYVYPEDEPLGQVLTDYLRRKGIRFEVTRVERHLVFWGLSLSVRPDEFLPEPYLTAYKRAHS